MPVLLSVAAFASSLLYPIFCFAVDETSSFYKAGKISGYIFLAVFAFLVIREVRKKF